MFATLALCVPQLHADVAVRGSVCGLQDGPRAPAHHGRIQFSRALHALSLSVPQKSCSGGGAQGQVLSALVGTVSASSRATWLGVNAGDPGNRFETLSAIAIGGLQTHYNSTME